MGPNLTGLFGRKTASRDDFRYSPAMTRADFVWDEAKLKAFLRDPQQLVRGTRMPFAGMDDEKDIEDVTAYIATLR